MKSRLRWLLLACLPLVGCSEEIDLTAPYEETAVVFGLINPLDTVQYVRISKAFLGEGNVYVMAQQSDSINYPDELQVTMERLTNSGVVETFSLTRVESIPKDSGLFAFPNQVYYSTSRRIRQDGSKYRLVVENTRTGYSARATTKIIPDISIIAPVSGFPVDFSTRLQTTYSFRTGGEARVYDLEMIFRFRTIYPSGSISYDSVLISFADELANPDFPTEEIEFPYYRPDFFLALNAQIPAIPNVIRRIDLLPGGLPEMEFRFFGGTEELYTYSQLTTPTNGIAQERPLYTNVENGVGLFTSRLIHSEYRNISVGTQTTIDTSQLTRDLNFEF
ncbi:MAG: DUF4249 family protein [Bacteroidota bacterium]